MPAPSNWRSDEYTKAYIRALLEPRPTSPRMLAAIASVFHLSLAIMGCAVCFLIAHRVLIASQTHHYDIDRYRNITVSYWVWSYPELLYHAVIFLSVVSIGFLPCRLRMKAILGEAIVFCLMAWHVFKDVGSGIDGLGGDCQQMSDSLATNQFGSHILFDVTFIPSVLFHMGWLTVLAVLYASPGIRLWRCSLAELCTLVGVLAVGCRLLMYVWNDYAIAIVQQ